MRKVVTTVTNKLRIFEMEMPWTYMPIPEGKVPNVRPGGWGSIPVVVTVGKTTWKTSIFPSKQVGYFLPIKKSIQKKENVNVGDMVTVKFTIT